MHFLEPPQHSSFSGSRSSSQTNFIIEEDSRSDVSDLPSAPGNESNFSARGFTLLLLTNPKWFRNLMCFFCFLLLGLAALSSAFGYLYFKTIPSFSTCKTRQCTRTATLLLKTMDETANPCEDFHKFACGNWISDTAAVVSVAVYDHTTIMRDRIVGRLRSLTENITNEDIQALQQVRIMYNTCCDLAGMEEAGLEPLIDLLLTLVKPELSVASTLALIHRHTNQDYIFDLVIGPGFRNTSTHLLSIDQPELPVVKANFLFSPKVIAAYENLISRVLTALSKHKRFPKQQWTQIPKDVKRISAFEQLFALSSSEEEERGKAATANLFTLRELNRMFSSEYQNQDDSFAALNSTSTMNDTQSNGTSNSVSPMVTNSTSATTTTTATTSRLFFNWTEYVETLFADLSPVDLHDDFVLNVNDVPYLRKVAELLAKSSADHLKMYIAWELLYTFGKDVTKEVRDYFTAFAAISEGTESTPNRHTECVLLLDQSLPFALTHKYILKYVKDSTIDEAKEMFTNVLHAFKHQVSRVPWMDGGTKLRAMQKANRVEAFIGYPRWLKNPSAVEEYYKGLRFTNDSFFTNILIMMQWIAEKQLRDFSSPVDTSWTSDSPAEADAFYDDERNAVTFPAGFLQEPFIGMGLKAIDYGALGSVMGHELTHGFDTMGRYSDEWGRLNSWWSLDTLDQFVNKATCFENQYDHYWLPELAPEPTPNNTVNGKRTLAENIADNGGIREAYQAYSYFIRKSGSEARLPGLEKYTPEHLFFLSFAQSWCSYLSPAALTDMVETNVHSPPKFRILGPLANFEEFSRIWECSPNSALNPQDKCILWG